ncbi:TPA: DUF2572 domain-containing protein, partial [Mannheimia haemolytica]|nr:DUF2572 domain-containing protein [Mannheimia haemolytica]
MNKYKNASALLVSLILISTILSVLFLSKEKWLGQQNITHFYREKYLSDQYNFLALYPQDKTQICQKFQKEQISQEDLSDKQFRFLQYQFACQFHSLFKDKKPTKEKYIHFTRLADYL